MKEILEAIAAAVVRGEYRSSVIPLSFPRFQSEVQRVLHRLHQTQHTYSAFGTNVVEHAERLIRSPHLVDPQRAPPGALGLIVEPDGSAALGKASRLISVWDLPRAPRLYDGAARARANVVETAIRRTQHYAEAFRSRPKFACDTYTVVYRGRERTLRLYNREWWYLLFKGLRDTSTTHMRNSFESIAWGEGGYQVAKAAWGVIECMGGVARARATPVRGPTNATLTADLAKDALRWANGQPFASAGKKQQPGAVWVLDVQGMRIFGRSGQGPGATFKYPSRSLRVCAEDDGLAQARQRGIPESLIRQAILEGRFVAIAFRAPRFRKGQWTGPQRGEVMAPCKNQCQHLLDRLSRNGLIEAIDRRAAGLRTGMSALHHGRHGLGDPTGER